MEFGGDDYDESVDHISDQQNPNDEPDYSAGQSEPEGSNQEQEEDQQQQEIDEEDEDYYQNQPQQQDIIEEQAVQNDQPNQERITTPFLTKYEKARVIGVRAVQISKNAPLYYTFGDNQNMDPLALAQRQLAQGKIPFIIRRYLPDGSYEHWKLSQLKALD